jgi:uncharacterized NAD(P)/FAD-binding protein YdhS
VTGAAGQIGYSLVFRIASGADVLLGAEVSSVLRWLRGLVECAEAQHQDWRTVVDGLRPHTQDIWRNWSETAKRRFLRHARAWWDIHRHRSAPEIDRRIKDAVVSGHLRIVAGRVRAIEPNARGATVTYRRRGATACETIHVAKIAQCIGLSVAPRESANPLLQNLLAQGLTRPDPIGVGLDVTDDCAMIDRFGQPSQRLFAVGPLTRGKFWEIVAIPDIRLQCAQLADRIVNWAPASPEEVRAPFGDQGGRSLGVGPTS